MFVRPLKGRVIDPQTGAPLPKEGRRVSPSSYWYRRLRDGDVARGELEPKESGSKKKASSSSKSSSEES